MSISLGVPPDQPATGLVWSYAGFWWRVLAFVLDGVVLSVADGLIARVTGLRHLGVSFQDDSDPPVATVAWTDGDGIMDPSFLQHAHWHGGVLTTIGLVMTVAYFVLLESSRWQATLGKRVCRIRVVDLSGRRIGIGRALGRYLGKYVSAALLDIGFLMVGWTRRKQGLHDMMAGTLVMHLRQADPVFAFQPPAR